MREALNHRPALRYNYTLCTFSSDEGTYLTHI